MLPSPDDFQAFSQLIWQAVTASNWRYLAALLVVGAVAVGSRFLKGNFWKSGAGKATLSMLIALLGGLSTAFAAGKVPSGAEILAALGLGWTASGGWSVAKSIFEYFAPKSDAP